jgi:selenocysteine-specific elongation factor
VIVATAGHVDHGKTSLVKALTGVDTDRLELEKERGMSIDLGFAHAELGGRTIGFVDVPGHERFIRNMAAGVACIDVALLVVAADDGPMPQTVEHLAILGWLGVPRCIVALTKVDRVDRAQSEAARAAIVDLLAHGPFRAAPIVAVTPPSGAGLDALRAELVTAADAQRSRPAAGRFRLAIDRCFSIAGAGTVVTGAVVAGRTAVGDLLCVSPHRHAVRVRAIQIHGRSVAEASQGERCALNLSGSEVRRTAIARGDWIVDPAAHAPTERVDVQLGTAAALARPLRHDAPVQLHLGAATVGARVALLRGRALEPGAEALAQLVLERPIGALHGDRFIVRDPAANRTLGGGRVIDPFGWPRGRAKPERLAELEALAAGDAAAALAARLAQAPSGIDFDRFAQARNLTLPEATSVLQRQQAITVIQANRAIDRTEAVALASGHRAWVLPSSSWHALQAAVVDALADLHRHEPDRLGAPESAVLAEVGKTAPQPLVHAAFLALLERGEIVRDGFSIRLPDHRAELAVADAALLERVCGLLQAAGLRPPIVGDLATALAVELPTLLGRLVDLARRGHLVQVAKNRFFMPATVAELARLAGELAAAAPAAGFDAAAYRDRSGLGRNLTIEVLEFLDRSGVTRFRDGRRHLIE